MFLKDKNDNNVLPNALLVSRLDSNPLIIELSGDATNRNSSYSIKSSRRNNYTISITGGILVQISGDIDKISHVKVRAFGNWPSASAKIRDIKISNGVRGSNAYGRPFYKTIKNSYSLGTEEIHQVPSSVYYTEPILCNDEESTVRAYLDYTIFPNQQFPLLSDKNWCSWQGILSYRSTYTVIPFDIEAETSKSIAGLYLGNCGNNTGLPDYWNVTLEIYEENEGKTINPSLEVAGNSVIEYWS